MEKTIVKRTGEFRVIEETNKRFSYAQITANCEIYNKKAEMTFKDAWDHENVGTLNWRFITGDEVVDSQAKVQTDFEIFKVLDIEVDNMEIIAEAKLFFKQLEDERKIAEAKEAKVKRAHEYDNNIFLKQLMPALEARDYKVSSSIKREDFINNNGSIKLLVETDNSEFTIDYDYHGWIEITGCKNVDDGRRVTKITKSKKIEKMIETLEDAIKWEKALVKSAKEKMKNIKDAKQTLEAALGIEVEAKKEWHSRGNSGRRSDGYYTEHFIDKKYSENGYYGCLRFTESSKTVNGETVKGFTISYLPVITDMKKLKQIYDLLIEE